MSNVITLNRRPLSAVRGALSALRGALAMAMLCWSAEAAGQESTAPPILPPVLVTAPPLFSSSSEQLIPGKDFASRSRRPPRIEAELCLQPRHDDVDPLDGGKIDEHRGMPAAPAAGLRLEP
jgi:hypothetical protein